MPLRGSPRALGRHARAQPGDLPGGPPDRQPVDVPRADGPPAASSAGSVNVPEVFPEIPRDRGWASGWKGRQSRTMATRTVSHVQKLRTDLGLNTTQFARLV